MILLWQLDIKTSVNAVVESLFGRLKQERVQRKHYQTRYEAQQDVLNYIILLFYNQHRLPSYMDYKSPDMKRK